MADDLTTVSAPDLPGHTARRNFVIASLLFHWALIGLVLCFGKPDNSLHSSALAWAFAASTATFVAYVFGMALDAATLMKARS
jgi:uncharacterized membrane protein